jgi:CxxC motif-containing protein
MSLVLRSGFAGSALLRGRVVNVTAKVLQNQVYHLPVKTQMPLPEKRHCVSLMRALIWRVWLSNTIIP